jgi:hypothetical protein
MPGWSPNADKHNLQAVKKLRTKIFSKFIPNQLCFNHAWLTFRRLAQKIASRKHGVKLLLCFEMSSNNTARCMSAHKRNYKLANWNEWNGILHFTDRERLNWKNSEPFLDTRDLFCCILYTAVEIYASSKFTRTRGKIRQLCCCWRRDRRHGAS